MAWWRGRRGIVPLDDSNLAVGIQSPTTFLPYALLAYPQFVPFGSIRLTAPLLQTNQSWKTAGLGGLQTGSTILQALMQNPNGS